MTSSLPGLLVALPVAASAIVALVPRGRNVVAILSTALVLLVAIVGLVTTRDVARIVLVVGGLPSDIGIVLVFDTLAAIAATVSLAVVLATQVALTGTRADDWPNTRPALLLLTAGVMLSFVTSDLFTMFVSFEIVLLGSYVLLTRDGDRAGMRVAPMYVLANLVASSVFLVGIAGIYAAAGTVNLAAVATAWGGFDPTLRLLIGVALLSVFATKAALVPLGAWLPGAYGALPPVLGAAIAALLTKVGVVALLRVSGVLDLSLLGSATGGVLAVVAAATMIVGVLVAIGQKELHRILAAHVVSQVGFMAAGVALLDDDGATGAILYLAHHVLVKGALLLVAAGLFARFGSVDLAELGGARRRAPLLTALFVVGGLTLAGLPPTSGFIAKLALLEAGISASQWLLVGSMAIASVLTLVSMMKIHLALQAPAPEELRPEPSARQAIAARGATAGAGALLLAGVAVAVFATPVLERAEEASATARDVPGLVEAVQP